MSGAGKVMRDGMGVAAWQTEAALQDLESPSFDAAAEPGAAVELYQKTAELIRQRGLWVKMGLFGEHMHVRSVNDGPVTLVLESL